MPPLPSTLIRVYDCIARIDKRGEAGLELHAVNDELEHQSIPMHTVLPLLSVPARIQRRAVAWYTFARDEIEEGLVAIGRALLVRRLVPIAAKAKFGHEFPVRLEQDLRPYLALCVHAIVSGLRDEGIRARVGLERA